MMAAKLQSREATPQMAQVESEFIRTALSKVRTPEYRHWLTLGFDALADIFACLENECGPPIAKHKTAALKRSRAR